VRIRTLGADQGGEDDATSQVLLEQLLSAGSFRPVRMPGDDLPVTTSQRTGGDENDPNIEDNEPGTPENDDDDDDDELAYGYWGRPRARTPKWFPPVTTPQEAGLKLLMGGEFGRVGVEARSWKGNTDISKVILSGRSRLRPTSKQDIASVRTISSLWISLKLESRPSSPTLMVQLSRHLVTTYTVANTPQVRASFSFAFSYLLMRRLDSSFYYTCCRGMFCSTPSIPIPKLY
jgi:hypothetical protein